MGTQVRFTRRDIEALQPAPAGKRTYYEDPRVPSIRLAVTDRGAKSWVIQRRIEGRVTRYTLGRFPELTPDAARLKAEQVLGKIAGGENPQTEKIEARAKRLTLAEAFEDFVRIRKLKPSTLKTYRQIIDSPLADWQNRSLVSITKNAVAERHAKLSRDSGGPYADSAMRTFRSIWNFIAAQYEDGSGESILPANPVERLSKTKAWHRPKRRRTYLSAESLPAWFAGVQMLRRQQEDQFARSVGDYLLTLVLTGFRRTEAATLMWSDIDLKTRTLTLPDTKNHEQHVLPLPAFLHRALIERQALYGHEAYVFTGEIPGTFLKEPRKQMLRVTKESGVAFVLHDLRRTFCTVAESLDLSYYSLKRLLNHRITGDVTAGYIGQNVERLREPMQKIEDYLLKAGGVIASTEVIDLNAVRERVGRGLVEAGS